MTDASPALCEEETIDAAGAALILGLAEAMLNRLPSGAFADDRLYVRAQALSEVLEAGMAVVDRSGQAHQRRLT